MEEHICLIHHYDCFILVAILQKNKKNIPGDADPVDFLIGMTWINDKANMWVSTKGTTKFGLMNQVTWTSDSNQSSVIS